MLAIGLGARFGRIVVLFGAPAHRTPPIRARQGQGQGGAESWVRVPVWGAGDHSSGVVVLAMVRRDVSEADALGLLMGSMAGVAFKAVGFLLVPSGDA